MKSIGIIAEYNPFHNGHLYHLNKIKELYPDHTIVLVLSPNFCQRGEPSIINKWDKTKIAKKAGIDLIIELPYVFATEAADIFAYGSTTILEKLKVNKVIFGSEENNLSKIETLVDCQLNNKEFDVLAKIYMKMGHNYPTALSLALEDLGNKKITLPNDLLGISYIKAIKKNNYNIKAECIKRTTDYHSEQIEGNTTSATSIRKALINNENIDNTVPEYTIPYLKENLHTQDNYFKFLKFKIMSEENLNIYQTVDEGLGDKIKKEIIKSTSYKDLIERIKSKRYTYNKINRMLCHILCNFTKEKKKHCHNIEYIRVLGFSKKGQEYLNNIKKDVDIPIITNYSTLKDNIQLQIEFQSTCAYASILDENKKKELIEMEYKNHPYKEDNND